ncbi:M20/M25/M40 family metallo-hydrolase, partial [Rhizobiaceae sp. 2RAB30]
PEMTQHAIAAASQIAGPDHVDGSCQCTMGAEDFSYMLEKRPGAIIWLGNGDSAGLHNPGYDFNDDAIPHGVRYWTALVGERLTGPNTQ